MREYCSLSRAIRLETTTLARDGWNSSSAFKTHKKRQHQVGMEIRKPTAPEKALQRASTPVSPSSLPLMYSSRRLLFFARAFASTVAPNPPT